MEGGWKGEKRGGKGKSIVPWLDGNMDGSRPSAKNNLPYEVLAMRTECRLLEEPGNESMILHIVNILLFEGAFPISLAYVQLVLLLLGHIIIVGHFCGVFVVVVAASLYTCLQITILNGLPLDSVLMNSNKPFCYSSYYYGYGCIIRQT